MKYSLRFTKGDDTLAIDTTAEEVATALAAAATRNGFTLVAREIASTGQVRQETTQTAYAPPLLESEVEVWGATLRGKASHVGYNSGSFARAFKVTEANAKRILYWLQRAGVLYYDPMSRMRHLVDRQETRV